MERAITRISLGPGCGSSGWADKLPAAGGTYLLGLRLSCDHELWIGRLGTFAFPAGWYAYTGSALGGLRARLRRHLRQTKALRWHIDYLLARAEPCEVWFVISPRRLECQWASMLATLPGAAIPVARFGASDCRCPAHLIHWPTQPAPDQLAALLAETG